MRLGKSNNDNKNMKLEELEDRIYELEKIIHMSNIGKCIEIIFIKRVFKEARHPPYFIQSYRNLCVFLERGMSLNNQYKGDKWGLNAYTEFIKRKDINDIRNRYKKVKTQYPDAVFYLDILEHNIDYIYDEDDRCVLDKALEWAEQFENQYNQT